MARRLHVHARRNARARRNLDFRRGISVVERLFSSRSLYRTLGLFFDFPHDRLNPRLISRYTQTDIKTVVIVLRKLEAMGLVRGRPSGRYRHYVLDSGHPLFEDLRSIFAKTKGERETLWRSHALKVWNELFR